jgi:pentatricopeptide repeat protein
LADESRLFAEILEARDRDPSGRSTLALLDEHARRFPDGVFVVEARAARIDALVRGGRSQAALSLLDRMRLEGGAQATELLILRGELRFEAHRRREAIEDFDRALADAEGSLEERAHYGRAVSLAALGDSSAARAELERYVERFPGGRFAVAARSALKK